MISASVDRHRSRLRPDQNMASNSMSDKVLEEVRSRLAGRRDPNPQLAVARRARTALRVISA
jgi:hypothetical protein